VLLCSSLVFVFVTAHKTNLLLIVRSCNLAMEVPCEPVTPASTYEGLPGDESGPHGQFAVHSAGNALL